MEWDYEKEQERDFLVDVPPDDASGQASATGGVSPEGYKPTGRGGQGTGRTAQPRQTAIPGPTDQQYPVSSPPVTQQPTTQQQNPFGKDTFGFEAYKFQPTSEAQRSNRLMDAASDFAIDGYQNFSRWDAPLIQQGMSVIESTLSRLRGDSMKDTENYFASRGLTGSSLEGDEMTDLMAQINEQGNAMGFNLAREAANTYANDRATAADIGLATGSAARGLEGERFGQGQSSLKMGLDEAFRQRALGLDTDYRNRDLDLRGRAIDESGRSSRLNSIANLVGTYGPEILDADGDGVIDLDIFGDFGFQGNAGGGNAGGGSMFGSLFSGQTAPQGSTQTTPQGGQAPSVGGFSNPNPLIAFGAERMGIDPRYFGDFGFSGGDPTRPGTGGGGTSGGGPLSPPAQTGGGERGPPDFNSAPPDDPNDPFGFLSQGIDDNDTVQGGMYTGRLGGERIQPVDDPEGRDVVPLDGLGNPIPTQTTDPRLKEGVGLDLDRLASQMMGSQFTDPGKRTTLSGPLLEIAKEMRQKYINEGIGNSGYNIGNPERFNPETGDITQGEALSLIGELVSGQSAPLLKSMNMSPEEALQIALPAFQSLDPWYQGRYLQSQVSQLGGAGQFPAIKEFLRQSGILPPGFNL